MTQPTLDEVTAHLAVAGEAYRSTRDRIAQLSLVGVLLETRAHFPTAAFIVVDETDQDTSGALVATDESVLGADAEIIDQDSTVLPDAEPWTDAIWGVLGNLDDFTEGVWRPFITEVDQPGGDFPAESFKAQCLDLDAIEALACELVSQGGDAQETTRRNNFALLTAAGYNPHKLSAVEYEEALDQLAEELAQGETP